MDVLKKLTYRNLKLNRKRTVVTVVGIILATALLCALSILGVSFYKSFLEGEKKTGGDYHVKFYPMEAEKLAVLEENRDVENVYWISDWGFAYEPSSKNEDKPYVHIVGTNRVSMEHLFGTLVEGRYPENENEILIPRHLKTNGRVDYKVGDELLFSVGERILEEPYDWTEYEAGNKLNADTSFQAFGTEKIVDASIKKYEVVGIIERPFYSLENYSAPGYTCVTYQEQPLNMMDCYVRFSKKGLKDYYSAIAKIMGLDTASNVELYRKYLNYEELSLEEYTQLRDAFDSLKTNFDVNSGLLSLESTNIHQNDYLRIMLTLCGIVAIIIMVTSVYCIKNSFDISVTERIRQFGMLASVGATRRQIKKSIYYEGFLLGLIGIPIGVGGGILAAYILMRFSNYSLHSLTQIDILFVISWWAVLVSILLAIITIYFSASASARRASKIAPIVAIRNQTEIKVKSGKLRAPGFISKLFGMGGTIAYKNMKRNKRKYRTTVVSIVICTATFIAISYFASMGYQLTVGNYGEQNYNISVRFNQDIREELQKDPERKNELFKILSEVEPYDTLSVVESEYLSVEQLQETERYETLNAASFGMSIEEYREMRESEGRGLVILHLDENSYKAYLKQVGVKNTDEKQAILINDEKMLVRSEDGRKSYYEFVQVYDAKPKNSITLIYENWENAQFDENDSVIEDTIEKEQIDIKLTAITSERPVCCQNNWGEHCIVVDDETWNILQNQFPDLKYSGIEYYYMSENADLLQDHIDVALTGVFGEEDSEDTSVYFTNNVDKDMREITSVLRLFFVFAYGLITVIALIGITNIVNTLNTSMELRSREFAMLRSVGMTTKEFNKMIRLETLFSGGKALFFGVMLGGILSYILYFVESRQELMGFDYEMPIKAMILSIVVVLAILWVIMKMSLTKMNRKNIIETIKDETT